MGTYYQGRFIGAVGLGVGVSFLTYLYYKFLKKEEIIEVIPIKWKQVGTLEEIHFFPIKSCAPVELDQALCENLGIQEGDIKDRALMIVDKNGDLVTARVYPKMLLIVSKVVSRTEIIISAPGMTELKFDYSKLTDAKNTKGVIFGHTAKVKDCGDEFNTWFSTFILGLPEGLKLVYYPYDNPTRPIADEFQNGIFSKRDTGSFQDVSSYHLINKTSVEDLNSRLDNKKVFCRQFRSNFYINTELAYGEDNWQWFRIGNEAVFRNIAPCFRCILPNINPFTAERDPDGQPLKTLKKYRMDSSAAIKSPRMGIQMGLRSVGTVKKGDAVFVEDLIE
ncbi:mitochondrial amidoxime reducing component 2-like [Episyrphus balteatus]|uniref:mitochondrial amidoxime reducing component 2-like n=1 Tax=Episyrphus balteatus TaxID=286459 RepID=UPI002486720B|nr:mitochondrial amidoxime reducing component 2-like [Episyrphus balteatus]XP_055845838.1 mitochondrial amidoxime reducing component 2-like [Episyrphus balteatus]XP_055845839.1 mitochondrial amidoxime reducing component 2-like [Episyrphus balteatus]XP_055845840.1 mitochondrial amidoxime reducing component 2-like [Episyrphus balteatus]XP_055845841.1 mitochondrial amidoxime reducing component 2-like [Episyrphus balteatus]XP_055845842.1 mitochondrial amidoxime reducing component 2-like [Episyrphu